MTALRLTRGSALLTTTLLILLVGLGMTHGTASRSAHLSVTCHASRSAAGSSSLDAALGLG